MLIAYCHLRKDRRSFRLDRMEDVAVLDKTFTRPSDFKMMRTTALNEDRTVTVRALFDHETARWVRDAPSFFQDAAENQPEGLLVTLAVRHPGEVLSREYLMKNVWRTDYLGDTRTVEVHIRWLRLKIEDDPTNPGYIQTVRGYGYRFISPDEIA